MYAYTHVPRASSHTAFESAQIHDCGDFDFLQTRIRTIEIKTSENSSKHDFPAITSAITFRNYSDLRTTYFSERHLKVLCALLYFCLGAKDVQAMRLNTLGTAHFGICKWIIRICPLTTKCGGVSDVPPLLKSREN